MPPPPSQLLPYLRSHSRAEEATCLQGRNPGRLYTHVAQRRVAGKYLRDHGILPDVVYLSPAVRAQQTWAEYGLPDVTTIVESRLRGQAGGVFGWLPLSATQAQRDAYPREAKQSLDARPPAGESIREHLARVRV